jgi:RHS repeat-associated protein
VEKTGTAVNSTKKFVCEGMATAEERNSSNKITRKHYPQGVQFLAYNPDTTTSYYYLRDHLGSIREMTDSTGAIKARYDYDPWGNRTKLAGGLDADFGFTGHYYHSPSNLHLAPYRAYDSTVGRWISRDPLGEKGGLNVYRYVRNNILNLTDPDGRNPLTGALIGGEIGSVFPGLGTIIGAGIGAIAGTVIVVWAWNAAQEEASAQQCRDRANEEFEACFNSCDEICDATARARCKARCNHTLQYDLRRCNGS